MRKDKRKMENELIEFGQVLVQWGMYIMLYGAATIGIGIGLIVIGKIFFEEKTDLLLATLAYHLGR